MTTWDSVRAWWTRVSAALEGIDDGPTERMQRYLSVLEQRIAALEAAEKGENLSSAEQARPLR